MGRVAQRSRAGHDTGDASNVAKPRLPASRGKDPNTVGDTTVGQTTIVARLGGGTFGDVYRGLTSSGRAVAIKLLKTEYVTCRAEAEEEIAALRMFSPSSAAGTPWVVPLLGVIEIAEPPPFTSDKGSLKLDWSAYSMALVMQLAMTNLHAEIRRRNGQARRRELGPRGACG